MGDRYFVALSYLSSWVLLAFVPLVWDWFRRRRRGKGKGTS